MLAIRLKRTGRKGHAQYRLIVQDGRFSPSSGRVVAYLGNYNPHSKAAAIDLETTTKFLQNGAQPSESAARLLQKEGVKLPGHVKLAKQKQKSIRNFEKLRKNRTSESEASESNATEDTSSEKNTTVTAEKSPETETEPEAKSSPEPEAKSSPEEESNPEN